MLISSTSSSAVKQSTKCNVITNDASTPLLRKLPDEEDYESPDCDVTCFPTECGTCALTSADADEISGDCSADERTWNGMNGGAWSALEKIPREMGDNSGALVDHPTRGKVLLTFGSYWKAGSYGYFFDVKEWEDIAEPPIHGDHMEAVVYKNLVYVFGGKWRKETGNRVQIYDIENNYWTFGKAMAWHMGGGNAVLINDIIYVCGGMDYYTHDKKGTTSQCGIYDPNNDSWSYDMTNMPYGRNHAAYGTDGKRMYIMTGRGNDNGDANGNTLKFSLGYDTIQIYDPATDTWTTSVDDGVEPSPVPRAGVTVAIYYQHEFWLIGGSSKQDVVPNPCIKLGPNNLYYRTDIYNPITNTWRPGPDMHFAAGATTPVIDYETEKIYLPGGATRENRSKPGAVFQVLDLKQAKISSSNHN